MPQINRVRVNNVKYNFGTQFYDDFMKAFILDGFEPNIVKEVNSLSEYFISIKLDEGIGYTGREVVPEEEDLCTVKIVGSHHHADFAVAYLKENKKAFILWLNVPKVTAYM